MGLNGEIPVGSLGDPNSVIGESLLWKNAQKNEMKNTSEIINKIIPHHHVLHVNVIFPN
jgi:hypothetical protein